MEIEYPDKSIHKVDCYRFCKARLNDGEEVYFIEYKDFFGKSNGEFVDSYAIINHSNGKWYKTERKIDYYTLFSHVVEEIDPGILGNRMNFRNESYAHSQSDGYIRTQRDYEEEKNELQIQTEPKREEIPPRNPNDGNIRNNGHSQNDGYIRTQRDYEEEKMEPQTQTEPKRGEIPPRKPNDGNIRIGEQIKVKNSADEYELQTQTEPKREKIPPRKPPVERPLEQNSKVVYVVLPTIDGKEEKIDFNQMYGNQYSRIPAYLPANGNMYKFDFHHLIYSYGYMSECLVYRPYSISDEIGKEIIEQLRKLSKTEDFNIEKISNMVIDGTTYQFVTSNKEKYAYANYHGTLYLPIKNNKTKIDTKDLLQRFMSGTTLGFGKLEDKDYEFLNGRLYEFTPQIKEKNKAILFAMMAENSKLKSVIEDHEMEDIAIPRDSYEFEETITKLKEQNHYLNLQVNMSPEERASFKKELDSKKQEEELKMWRLFFAKMNEETYNQMENTMEDSYPSR